MMVFHKPGTFAVCIRRHWVRSRKSNPSTSDKCAGVIDRSSARIGRTKTDVVVQSLVPAARARQSYIAAGSELLVSCSVSEPLALALSSRLLIWHARVDLSRAQPICRRRRISHRSLLARLCSLWEFFKTPLGFPPLCS